MNEPKEKGADESEPTHAERWERAIDKALHTPPPPEGWTPPPVKRGRPRKDRGHE